MNFDKFFSWKKKPQSQEGVIKNQNTGNGRNSSEENDLDHIQSRLLRDRIIFLGSAIDDKTAATVTAQLLFLARADEIADIFLYINSPGGSVSAGLAIYGSMQEIKPDVVTVCTNVASGISTVLLSAGTKGKRIALSGAQITITRIEGGRQVQHSDDQTSATWQQRKQLELGYHQQNLTEILAYHTGQSVKKIYQDTESNYFLLPLEARQYGIIDTIIEQN